MVQSQDSGLTDGPGYSYLSFLLPPFPFFSDGGKGGGRWGGSKGARLARGKRSGEWEQVSSTPPILWEPFLVYIIHASLGCIVVLYGRNKTCVNCRSFISPWQDLSARSKMRALSPSLEAMCPAAPPARVRATAAAHWTKVSED